jgi:hypothetical protein
MRYRASSSGALRHILDPELPWTLIRSGWGGLGSSRDPTLIPTGGSRRTAQKTWLARQLEFTLLAPTGAFALRCEEFAGGVLTQPAKHPGDNIPDDWLGKSAHAQQEVLAAYGVELGCTMDGEDLSWVWCSPSREAQLVERLRQAIVGLACSGAPKPHALHGMDITGRHVYRAMMRNGLALSAPA